jgi:hypothetical protein
MAQVTWLGDEDPSAQSIKQYGHTFVKGVPTAVPDKDPYMAKFKGASVFHVKGEDKGNAAPVESKKEEPKEPVDEEVAALRADLDAAGEKWHHRSNAETLRSQLAQATLAKQKAEHTAQ